MLFAVDKTARQAIRPGGRLDTAARDDSHATTQGADGIEAVSRLLRALGLQFLCVFGVAAVALSYAFPLLPSRVSAHSGPREVLVLILAYGLAATWVFICYVRWTPSQQRPPRMNTERQQDFLDGMGSPLDAR